MKIASMIARYLLGLMFLIFGLNGFLHFIPQGPMPGGAAGQFVGALMATNYMWAVSAVEVVSALFLLANRYVPLALTLIGPVLVNILLFHIFMMPQGLPPGILATICWFLVFLSHRAAFDGVLQSKSA